MTQPLPPFPRTLILGLGLLGASLGLALKKHRLTSRILGVGRPNSPSLQIALTRGAIDQPFTDLATVARQLPAEQDGAGPNLIILATPIRQVPAALKTLAPILPPHTHITDVGSTKSQVLQWAADILPPHVHFVGSHPMAGSEKRGPDAARDDLYEGAVCLLCPNEKSPDATDRIASLWQSLSMRILRTDPATHDRWVAAISHLPHALAFSLVNAAAEDPACLQAIAGGFIDATRIASSDTDMWTDIFLTNRPALTAALDQFIQRLTTLRSAIASADEPAIRTALTAAKKIRDNLPDPRKRSTE